VCILAKAACPLSCGENKKLRAPFRNYHYYQTTQKGSASIKEVLPAVTGKDYNGMEIAHGGDASLAFLSLLFDDLSDFEKQQLRTNLEKYCGLDTEGMIWILDTLKKWSIKS
jgi:hypothetical protein